MFGNPDGDSSWNTKPVKVLERTRLQVGDEEYVFNPKIEQAVSNTSLDSDNLTNDEILPFNDILQTVVYQNLQTKRRSKMSRKFQNIKQILSQKLKTTEDGPDFLQGEGTTFIFPFTIIDFWTRIKIVLGLKVSAHTNTLTGGSNSIDE